METAMYDLELRVWDLEGFRVWGTWKVCIRVIIEYICIY